MKIQTPPQKLRVNGMTSSEFMTRRGHSKERLRSKTDLDLPYVFFHLLYLQGDSFILIRSRLSTGSLLSKISFSLYLANKIDIVEDPNVNYRSVPQNIRSILV